MMFPLWIVAYTLFLFIGVTLYLLPAWMPSTVPFGVRVPLEFSGDPVLVRLRHQYRRRIAALGLGVLFVLVVATRFLPPTRGVMLLPSILPLFWIGAGYAAYYATRRQLLAIKAKQGWYEGQRTAAAAEIPENADTDRLRTRSPELWIVPMIAIATATLLLTLWRYPHLPAVLPTHFGPSGQPDAYAKKSVVVALIPFFAQSGLILLIGLIIAFVRRMRTPLDPALPRTSAVQQRVFRHRMTMALGVMGITTALSLSATELGVLNVLPLPIAGWGIVLFLMLGLAVTMGIVARTGQLGGRVQVGVKEQPTGTAARDDDRFWKGGVFYYNPENPAFWVPKRFGVGWTLNFAHPGSWIVIGGIVILFPGLAVAAVHLF